MKRNLDTGVEVYDNKVKKKKQRHTTNEKPDEDLYYGSKYWLFLLNISKYLFG